MEHPATERASAAKPDRSNINKNKDNATQSQSFYVLGNAEKTASSVEQRSSASFWLSGGTSEEQDEQQQPGKPVAAIDTELLNSLALSSAVGTGQTALATVGSSAGKTSQQPKLAIRRDVLTPLLDACTWDHATGAWLTPATEPDAGLWNYPWQNMLKLPPGWTPTSFVPTFFHDEPDPNQRDKPRLDIVVSFDNGHSVRYHPSANPIWSTCPQPTDAMKQRYNRKKKIDRSSNVD